MQLCTVQIVAFLVQSNLALMSVSQQVVIDFQQVMAVQMMKVQVMNTKMHSHTEQPCSLHSQSVPWNMVFSALY